MFRLWLIATCLFVCPMARGQSPPDSPLSRETLLIERQRCRDALTRSDLSIEDRRRLLERLIAISARLNDMESLNDFQSFMNFAEEVQDRQGIAMAAGELARIYFSLGQKKLAKKYALQAVTTRQFEVRSAANLLLARLSDDPNDRQSRLQSVERASLRVLSMAGVPVSSRRQAVRLLASSLRLQSENNASAVAEVIVKVYRQRLLNDDDVTDCFLAVAGDCLAEDDSDFAVELLRAAVPVLGSAVSQTLLLNLAYLHEQRAETAEMIKVLEAYTSQAELTPETAKLFERLASLYATTEKYEQALSLYQRLLQLTVKTKNLQNAVSYKVNIGATELALGDLSSARSHFESALDDLQAKDSLAAASCHNGLGEIASQECRFRDSVDHFQQAIDILRARGEQENAGRLSIFLNNLAQVFLKQRLFGRAERCIDESSRINEGAPDSNRILLTKDYLTLADIAESRGEFERTEHWLRRALDIVHENKDARRLFVSTLERYGRLAFIANEFQKADKAWKRCLELYQELDDRVGQSTVLNLIAQSALAQGNYQRAKTWLLQAHQLYKDADQSNQLLQFSTLANLAVTHRKLGEHQQAIELMKQAIDVCEQPRHRSFGGGRERAITFSQFAPAYYYLLEWMIQDAKGAGTDWQIDDIVDLLAVAERLRNRSYLEELNSEPEEPVFARELAPLKQQRSNILQEVARLRQEARTCTSVEQWTALKNQFAGLQAAYSEVATAIESILHGYRDRRSQTASPQAIKVELQRYMQGKQALLYFILTHQTSYVACIGPNPGRVCVTALTAPASIRNNGQRSDWQLAATRGPVQIVPMFDVQEKPAVTEPGTAIGRELVDAIVRDYLYSMGQPAGDQRAPRRLVEFSETTPQLPEPALGDVFVPLTIRQQLKTAHGVTVVRDWPLFSLPLEGLKVHAQDSEATTSVDGDRCLLDVLPPVSYAPSLTALLMTTDGDEAADSLTVLTCGDVPYGSHDRTGLPDELGIELLAPVQLAALPATAQESAAVAQAFQTADVQQFTGQLATEFAVVGRMKRANVIHLAAHGIVHQDHDNQFGAIVLAPGEGRSTDDDGYLSVYEIRQLDLRACRLAILSACQTNVGAHRPLETPASLARAFLTAGARRVVSSSWQVSDDSTALLIGTFCQELGNSIAESRTADYARALRNAKQKVRSRYPHPYYWASFTLDGSPN